MKDNNKIGIIILICFILFFVLQNISALKVTKDPVDTSKFRYKFVLIKEENDTFYWDNMEVLLKKYAKEKDIFIEVLEAENTGFNFQKEMIEMARLVKPDGIIINGFNQQEMNEVAIQSKAEEIPIIFVKDEGNNESRTTYIGQNNYKVGQKSMNELLSRTSEELNILIIGGKSQAKYKNTTIDGMLSVINKTDQLNLIGIKNIDNRYILDSEIKQALIENDTINTIIASKSFYGIVAAETVIRANKVGDIKIVAFDQLPQTLGYIENEVIDFSIYNNQEKIAQKVLEVLINASKEKFVGDVYYTPTDIISKENIDKYLGVDTDEEK